MDEDLILEKAGEACEVAREALAVGDLVAALASIIIAAELVRLARIFQHVEIADHG